MGSHDIQKYDKENRKERFPRLERSCLGPSAAFIQEAFLQKQKQHRLCTVFSVSWCVARLCTEMILSMSVAREEAAPRTQEEATSATSSGSSSSSSAFYHKAAEGLSGLILWSKTLKVLFGCLCRACMTSAGGSKPISAARFHRSSLVRPTQGPY